LVFSPTEHVLAWASWTTLGILDYGSAQTNTFPISGAVGFCSPAFSADGRDLAFAAPTNIMILDMATRTARPFAAIENTVFGLAFSPNGLLLATAHHGGDVTLWDRATGRAITNYDAHPPMASGVEFSPDGRLLASGGADGMGKLWEVVPGGLKLLYKLRGHVGRVDVFFLPDGRRLVSSGSSDNGLKLWDTRTGLEVGTLYGNGSRFAGVARSHDSNAIYSAAEDGDVRIWQAPPRDRLKAPGKEEVKR